MKTRSSPQKPDLPVMERPSVQVKSFLDASPLAAIFSDESGTIRWFNPRAQTLLNYSEENFPSDGREVYYEKGEAERIGEELGKNRGVLKDRLTSLRSQRGECIVVRLSATTIYDAEGKRRGVVGYFEDMRSFQILETRVQSLARATLTLAQHKKLDEGLAKLAELVVALLPHTFCRILLLNENEDLFTVKAAAVYEHLNGTFSWNPQVGTSLRHTSVLGSFDIRSMQEGLLLHWNNPAHQLLLRNLSSQLELQQPVYSLLRATLGVRGKLMGLLEIGEIERQPIPDDERTLALAIAAQASIFVERLQQHELSKRRNLLLERLELVS